MRLLLGVALIAASLITGCRPKQQTDLSQEISGAVQATLSALPQPTAAFPPTAVTTQSLAGIFCEYEFCIGHPDDVPLFDAKRQSNNAEFSSYPAGRVAGYRDDIFIIVAWVDSAGAWDPQGMMRVLEDEFAVSPNGDMKVDLLESLNVGYQPATTPSNSVFSDGLAAAWRCGNRDFVWMGFSTHAGEPASLLTEALQRFRCESR